MSSSQPDLIHLLPGPQVLPLPGLKGTQSTGQESHGVWNRSDSQDLRPYIDLTPLPM